MTREEFKAFVGTALRDVLQIAQEKMGRHFPDRVYLRWYPRPEIIRDDIADAITSRVFVDSEHIYPCVDMGVGEVLEDGTPIVFALVAGYAPGSFGRNWTGRNGPFVYIVGRGISSTGVFACDIIDFKGIQNTKTT
jgi:hypothetical protein